jgi:hypothetical protein
MKLYLDSSILLRYLLSGETELLRTDAGVELASSELIKIECKRVLQRERLEGHIDDARYGAAMGMARYSGT